MGDGTVECVREGAVLRLTLNRPDRRNSLSHNMTDRLVTELTAAALARLGERTGRLRAGLAWAGNPRHANDRRRSCPLWRSPASA